MSKNAKFKSVIMDIVRRSNEIVMYNNKQNQNYRIKIPHEHKGRFEKGQIIIMSKKDLEDIIAAASQE